MKICLIVLNYNDYITTIDFIENTKMIKLIDKIIVVDNKSTDNSLEILKRYRCDKIDVICTNKNQGYASGNNYGFFYALNKYNPQYIIIANPDVDFKESAVEKMQNCIENISNCGVVACKMKCLSGINLPIASKIPSFKDCLLENLIILSKIIGKKFEYDKGKSEDGVIKVEVLPGSLFMINANVFSEIGGFDENTFLYYEENILAFKLKKNGYDNYLIVDEEYIHKHSVSINKSINSIKKRLKIAFSSRYYFCEKYLKCNWIQLIFLKISFIIGLYDYLIAIKILKKH